MKDKNTNLIPSFSVDHTAIIPGIFTSRVDQVGNSLVTTYDIRLTRPNKDVHKHGIIMIILAVVMVIVWWLFFSYMAYTSSMSYYNNYYDGYNGYDSYYNSYDYYDY